MDVVDKIEMILRQTNYDKTTAAEKKQEHNNDAIQVIRDYLNAGKTPKPCTTKLSVNQQIYKEIRGMMDTAAKNYQVKKECEAKEGNI